MLRALQQQIHAIRMQKKHLCEGIRMKTICIGRYCTRKNGLQKTFSQKIEAYSFV